MPTQTELEQAREWLRGIIGDQYNAHAMRMAEVLLAATKPVPEGELAEAVRRLMIYCEDIATGDAPNSDDYVRERDIRTVLQTLRQQQAEKPEADQELVKAVRECARYVKFSTSTGAAVVIGRLTAMWKPEVAWTSPALGQAVERCCGATEIQLHAAIRQVLREKGESGKPEAYPQLAETNPILRFLELAVEGMLDAEFHHGIEDDYQIVWDQDTGDKRWVIRKSWEEAARAAISQVLAEREGEHDEKTE